MARRASGEDPDPFRDACEQASLAEGLDVTQLSREDVIDVETQNHVYTFIISDPAKGGAEVMSNGEKIVDPSDAVIVGSLIGDTTVAMKRILLGHRLEVAVVDGKTFRLSPTKRIAVNGVTILPRGAGGAN